MSRESYQGFVIESGVGTRPDVLNRWGVHWFAVSDDRGELFTALVQVSRRYAEAGDMVEVAEAYGIRWVHGILNLGRFTRGGAYERTLSTDWKALFGELNLDEDLLREVLLQAARRVTTAEDRTGHIHGLDVEGIALELGIEVDRVRGSLAELVREGLLTPHLETFGHSAKDGACQITGQGLKALRQAQTLRKETADTPTAAQTSFDRSHIGVVNLGIIDTVSGTSSSHEEANLVAQRRETLTSLEGTAFATAPYRDRLVLRMYFAPTRSVARIRFGDSGRALIRVARREYLPNMSEGEPSAEEMRFHERRIRDLDETVAQVIVSRDGQCHYVEILPTLTGATREERLVPLSTLLRALTDMSGFVGAALPRLFGYDGTWYCGVLLEHVAAPLRVLFDVYAPASEPHRMAEPQLPSALRVDRDHVALGPATAIAADVAKELVEGLAYEGGDAYIDAWTADGARL